MAIEVRIVEADGYPGPSVDVLVYDRERPRRDGKPVTSLFARHRGASLYVIDIQSNGGDRGRGYGTRALAELVEWARARGIGVIEGVLGPADWERRDKLIAFYERRGATVTIDPAKQAGQIVWRLHAPR